LRTGSGGKGQFTGGEGISRSYRFLKDVHVSILSERRIESPYGLAGGEPGQPGENFLVRDTTTGDTQKTRIKLGSKLNIDINAGEILIINTPGGGGFGTRS